VPSIVTPFAGDQFFWAERLRLAGVAPAAIDGRRPTAEAFARALGETMRAEDGVEDAVAVLERIVGS